MSFHISTQNQIDNKWSLILLIVLFALIGGMSYFTSTPVPQHLFAQNQHTVIAKDFTKESITMQIQPGTKPGSSTFVPQITPACWGITLDDHTEQCISEDVWKTLDVGSVYHEKKS